MSLLFGAPIALLCFGLLFSGAWACGLRGLGTEGRASTRLAFAILASLWALLMLFEGLTELRLFFAMPALILTAAIGGVGVYVGRAQPGAPSPRAVLRQDLSRIRSTWSGLSRITQTLLLLAAILALLQTSRALVSPPQGWDTLTYHLFKSARWVQSGTSIWADEPDAWSYYEYYPASAEVLWAWTLIPLHGDTLVGLGPIGIWLALLLGAWATCRTLGADPDASALGALLVATVPAVSATMAMPYVDNLLLAAVVLGLPFILQGVSGSPSLRSTPILAFSAGASLALAAGAKISGLPWTALGICLVALPALRRPGRSLPALLALVAGLLPMSFHYLAVWITWGSPVYPMALSLGPFGTWPGNEMNVLTFAGTRIANLVVLGPWAFLSELAAGRWNFPLVLPLVLPLALAGLVPTWRRPGIRWVLGALLLWGAYATVEIMSPGMQTERAPFWAPKAGRLLLPVWLILVLLAQGSRRPWSRPVWQILAALSLTASLRMVLVELQPAESAALAGWAPALACFLILVAASGMLLARAPGLGRWAFTAFVGLFAWAWCATSLEDLRARWRYPIWAETAQGGTFRSLDLAIMPTSIWQALDTLPGRRIAFVAGVTAIGHTWLRYPLTGSKLQNTVVYVPPTDDGRVYNGWDGGVVPHLDEAAWLRRLRDERIDKVVMVSPWPPEFGFVQAHPEIFRCAWASVEKFGVLCDFLAPP